MLTRPYGSTGKEVTVISFGGMRFPDQDKTEEMAEIAVHAYNKGINYFDTAPGYGKSEDIYGAAFAQMDRSKFYVSTKSFAGTAEDLRKNLETSLERMKIEKIDFFHIWCVNSMESWEKRVAGGVLTELAKAKEEGLVEHIVVSSHLPGEELGKLLEQGPIEGVLLGYCAINFPYREKAIELAAKRNLGVMIMNPLGGGMIPENPERFDFLRGPEDKSVVQAALRFVVSNPGVTSALVGFSSKEQVDQACEAMENFTPYTVKHTEAVRENILGSFKDMCTGCRYCLPCPNGVPIPEFMETYNLHLLYPDNDRHTKARLKWHWNQEPAKANLCNGCGVCETRCTQHLDIRERLKYIATLVEEETKA